jgi:hypothetical protein
MLIASLFFAKRPQITKSLGAMMEIYDLIFSICKMSHLSSVRLCADI